MTPTPVPFSITVVTPVHVGSGENRARKGLDFVIRSSENLPTLSIIDLEATYVNLSPAGRSNFLAQLNQGELNDKDPKYNLIYKAHYPIASENIPDFSVAIRSAGKPLLPGSSIKGALRSLAQDAYKNFGVTGDRLTTEAGAFEKSLWRFIKIRDVFFEKTQIAISKIASVNTNNDNEAVWKHERKGGITRFNHHFTTACECIAPGEIARSEWIFTLMDQGHAALKNLSFHNQKLAVNEFGQAQKWFCRLAKNYMQNYIQSEITFHEEFEGLQYHADLIDAWAKLAQVNASLNENQMLFRLGWGVGSHHLTGNYAFPDHTESLKNGYGKQRKTRRWAYASSRPQETLVPLGFTVIDFSEKPQSLPPEAARIIHAWQELSAQPVVAPEPEKQKEPEWLDLASLPRNNPEVNAEVLGKDGKNLNVKLFIRGLERKVFKARYPSGLDAGTIIVVAVQRKGAGLDEFVTFLRTL